MIHPDLYLVLLYSLSLLLHSKLIFLVANMSLYWGYFHGNAKIKTSGKWKESDWIVCDRYVPYALGGGYILSKSLITYMARNADQLK